MLRDGWNFKNDIALPLEWIARTFYGYVDRPYKKIFDSDTISSYSFVESMIIVLREKSNYTNENQDIEEFVKKCSPYFGKNSSEIDSTIEDSLFKEFLDLYGAL